MTELDRELEQLAALINVLSRQAQAAIFWAVSTVYSASAHWRLEESKDLRPLLLQAQDAVYEFCLVGFLDEQSYVLLEGLDRPLPEDAVAQSAWICADAALRIAIDASYISGMSI